VVLRPTGRLLPYLDSPSPSRSLPTSFAPSAAHRAFLHRRPPPSVISTCGAPLSFSQSLFSTRSPLYTLSLMTLMKSDIGGTNARIPLVVPRSQPLPQLLYAQLRLAAGPPLTFRQLLHRAHPPLLRRRLLQVRRPLLLSNPLCLPRQHPPALPAQLRLPRLPHPLHLREFVSSCRIRSAGSLGIQVF
jgi:hypothetical protein